MNTPPTDRQSPPDLSGKVRHEGDVPDTLIPYQVKVIRGYILVTALLTAGFAIFNFNRDLLTLALADVVVAITLAVSLWWSFRHSSLNFLQHVTLISMGAISLILFFKGGLLGVGYVWILGFPFVAFFLAGSRIGLWYTSVLMCILAFYNFGAWQWEIDVYWSWSLVSYLGIVYIFFALAGYFSVRAREKNAALAWDAQKQLKQETEALIESERRHRALLDASPNAIGVHFDEKWVYANPAMVKMFAENCVEDMLGVSVLDYTHADYKLMAIERMKVKLKGNVSVPMVEQKMIRKNGKVFVAETQDSPVFFEGKASFLVSCKDISERKMHEKERQDLQSQLEHAQRLESLGILAGGIAHDFNNLLAAIGGNAELARMEVAGRPVAVEHLNHIESSCEHAAELCQQMLAYAGKGKYILEVLNINSMLRALSRLIRASVSSNIVLKMKLNSQLPSVEGDMAQIQQIMLNFIVNSSEAIGEEAGEIKVTTDMFHAKRDFLDKLYNGTNLSEGEYVMFEVKDSGCGMDQDLRNKIFDPFFTTKETGTGLGLSAVLGIVRAHKGAVQLLSKPSEGTVFRVFLPPSDQSPATRIVVTSEVEDWCGDGTVLIVDDDSNVRAVASAFMKSLHFDVMTAHDGQHGVNVFHKHHKNIQVVLLDMTMPKLGGMDAMREMREINSAVPIIMISGYSEKETESLIKGDKPDAFVQKPFKLKDLKKSLYKVMTVSNEVS